MNAPRKRSRKMLQKVFEEMECSESVTSEPKESEKKCDDRLFTIKEDTGMAPNMKENMSLANSDEFMESVMMEPKRRKYDLVYSSILMFTYWHIGGLYGLYLCFTSVKWATIGLNLFMYVVGGWGITAGTHRLWAHRAYKANLPLQAFLMICQTMSCQKTVLNWVRDHRLHHKYTDTDADPHNATRGFFFSHIGWLMLKKHPEVIKKGQELDMSDLLDNPVLKFQKKYYGLLASLLVFILPALIPVLCWGETLNNSHHVSLLRLILGSHITFSINSVAHLFGTKPYDKSISPTQNVGLSLLAFGEGYHNYHHIFPFDYRVAELGNNYINFSTKFIDFCAWCGWAYDLKYASSDMIEKRAKRTGDGTDLWGRAREDMKGL